MEQRSGTKRFVEPTKHRQVITNRLVDATCLELLCTSREMVSCLSVHELIFVCFESGNSTTRSCEYWPIECLFLSVMLLVEMRCFDRCNVPMARLIVVAGVVVFIVINRSVRAVLLVLLGDGG